MQVTNDGKRALRDRLADRLRHEARIIIHVTWRDLPKRLAVTTLMVGLMVYADRVGAALAVGAVIVASESLFVLIYRHFRSLGTERELSTRLVLANWINNSLSTFAFCAPSVVLASVPSLPMTIAALTWIYGVLVHITNTFVAMPIYNRSQVIPCYLALLVTIAVAAHVEHAPAPLRDWWLLVAFVAVYASNTVQTMTMQRDTLAALDRARDEAQARLRELERLARHDSLTGLPNRPAFEADFVRMQAAHRGGGSSAVMVIDLDGFKPINDSYGHSAGDHVLREISARLTRLAGERGIAARIGGDEFALARPDVPDRETALAMGRCVVRELERTIEHGGIDLGVGASVGVALARPGDRDAQRLIAEADQAMYRAKSAAAEGIAVFDESFAPRLSLDDKRRLLRALSEGEIRPHYQPKVSLATGRIIGFEALARWRRPDGRIEMPDSFLPQIDELGLHRELVESMAVQVIGDLARLRAAGLGAGRVALNLPEAALATSGVRAMLIDLAETVPDAMSNLTLEITEDVLISRSGSQLQDSIAAFRGRGALISLDDFGTGFASFQHLRQLEFDELKIDRSFVAGLCVDGAAAVLVEGFISIARGLGVSVVAEGVETRAQEARLKALGCPTAQGYRYGAALPLAETEMRLLAHGPIAAVPTRPVTPPEALPPPAGPGAGDGPRRALPYRRSGSRQTGGG